MAKNVLPSAAAQQTEPEKAKGRGAFWSNLAGIFLRRREASIIVVAILLVIYFQASNQNFSTQANIRASGTGSWIENSGQFMAYIGAQGGQNAAQCE